MTVPSFLPARSAVTATSLLSNTANIIWSLLAGLNSIDCEVGQMLLAGEPIGQMPKSAEAKLYVELREDSRPIDPEAWFAK